ncbi:MAG: hypothetical protein K9M54_08780 [Kiritimatiellales bacterium]|nr:hypothetical protein [Kiritimatiellales bacterium]
MMKTRYRWGMILALVTGLYTANAQTYTWDVTPGTIGSGDSAITAGAGTWDTSTGNWTTDSGTNNVAWVNGSDAYFGAGGYTVGIANSGVSVGGLSIGGNVTLKALTDNLGAVTVSGSKTWDLNGNTLTFVNDTLNDTKLNVTSGQTLTVQSTGGGGTFNAGEKPTGSNWGVGGATLDFQADTLKGSADSIGQFGTVKMVGGSTYIHERNSVQTYANNWELGAGTVTFANRYNRGMTFTGAISGDGGLQFQDFAGQTVTLSAGNTFKGGLILDETVILANITADSQLGDTAGSVTLKNNAAMVLAGVSLSSSRTIALDNGGTIVNTTNPNTFDGKITGTGGLSVGRTTDSLGNKLTLGGDTSDYSGGTRIVQGTLALGIDNALPQDTVVTIGGKSTSVLDMNGFDQTIAGLAAISNNTRRVDNTGATASTLTINVANGETYSYIGNIGGTSQINLVKTGAGTQRFTKTSTYLTTPASISVEDGTLVWNATGSGSVGVGLTGTLAGTGSFDGAVTVAGNLTPGSSPGTMTFTDSLTLESTATLTLDIAGTGSGEYDVLANDGGDTLTAGGALVFNTTGYSATLGDSFTVFTNWGGFAASTFDSIAGTDLGGGLSFDTSSLLTDGTITVIPEPATLGMVALLGAGILWIRRAFTI